MSQALSVVDSTPFLDLGRWSRCRKKILLFTILVMMLGGQMLQSLVQSQAWRSKPAWSWSRKLAASVGGHAAAFRKHQSKRYPPNIVANSRPVSTVASSLPSRLKQRHETIPTPLRTPEQA